MEELEESIRNMRKRYEVHNFARPLIVCSDRPEMDRSILWEKIWPSLQPTNEVASNPCYPDGLKYFSFQLMLVYILSYTSLLSAAR